MIAGYVPRPEHFVSSAKKGDVIQLALEATEFRHTSVTLRCHGRNTMTGKSILTVDKMVFVSLAEDGAHQAHGRRLEAADIA
jgi:acyl-CoA hydrolase